MPLDFLPGAHILCPKMPLHPQYLSKISGYHLFLRLHLQCHMLRDTCLKSVFPSLLLKITDFRSWIFYLKIIPLLDGCMHGVINGWLIFLTPFFPALVLLSFSIKTCSYFQLFCLSFFLSFSCSQKFSVLESYNNLWTLPIKLWFFPEN